MHIYLHNIKSVTFLKAVRLEHTGDWTTGIRFTNKKDTTLSVDIWGSADGIVPLCDALGGFGFKQRETYVSGFNTAVHHVAKTVVSLEDGGKVLRVELQDADGAELLRICAFLEE